MKIDPDLEEQRNERMSFVIALGTFLVLSGPPLIILITIWLSRAP